MINYTLASHTYATPPTFGPNSELASKSSSTKQFTLNSDFLIAAQDYDLFQEAAEFEELFEFLKLAPQKSVSTAAVSVTVTEVGLCNGMHYTGYVYTL